MADCACDVTAGQLDQLSHPSFFFVELTSACNNTCSGCSNVFASRNQAPLSDIEWRRLLEQLAPYSPRLKVTGGEPTLHPEFEAVIRHIRALDMPFTLFTNGRWQQRERLVSFLAEVPQLEGLLISLHGVRAESHEAFTCMPGSFEETVANIQLAVRTGLTVVISTVLTRHSYKEIAKVVTFSQALGADHVDFNRYIGKSLPGLAPTEKELLSAILEIERFISERQLVVVNGKLHVSATPVRYGVPIPSCFAPNHSYGCLSGIAHATIDPWGNVRPCTHAPLVCGNLLEQSIEEVWHGPEMQRWREMIPAQCHDCLELCKCHGGCRAMAVLHGLERDPLIGEPILERAQEPPEELVLCETAYHNIAELTL